MGAWASDDHPEVRLANPTVQGISHETLSNQVSLLVRMKAAGTAGGWATAIILRDKLMIHCSLCRLLLTKTCGRSWSWKRWDPHNSWEFPALPCLLTLDRTFLWPVRAYLLLPSLPALPSTLSPSTPNSCTSSNYPCALSPLHLHTYCSI